MRRLESADLRGGWDAHGSAAGVQPHASGRREAAHWPLVCGALATAFAAALAKEIGITAVSCAPARRLPAGLCCRRFRLRPRQPVTCGTTDVRQSCKIGACWRGLWCPRAVRGQKILPYAHSMPPVRSAPWRCTMPSCCPGRQYRALRRSRRPAQRARLRLHHSCPAGRRVLLRWGPRARCASPTLQSYDGRCHVRLLRKHRPGH